MPLFGSAWEHETIQNMQIVTYAETDSLFNKKRGQEHFQV